jgi:hypothetical protein
MKVFWNVLVAVVAENLLSKSAAIPWTRGLSSIKITD